jgi:hypothetical protein
MVGSLLTSEKEESPKALDINELLNEANAAYSADDARYEAEVKATADNHALEMAALRQAEVKAAADNHALEMAALQAVAEYESTEAEDDDVPALVEYTEDMGSSSSSVVAVWTRVWARELEILKEMGFSETAKLLPLLQEHIGIPASLSAGQGDGERPQVAVEGMQRLVATLLNNLSR